MQFFLRGLSMVFISAPLIVQAGVITDAQPLTVSLTKILNFLLIVFGAIAILGMLMAGFLYFTAAGDERKVRIAKRAFLASITGTVIVLSSMILIWTFTELLS